jgi:hypothetical protein
MAFGSLGSGVSRVARTSRAPGIGRSSEFIVASTGRVRISIAIAVLDGSTMGSVAVTDAVAVAVAVAVLTGSTIVRSRLLVLSSLAQR